MSDYPPRYDCQAGRGDLRLFYEDAWVAFDITERSGHDRPVYTEVFLGVGDLDRIITDLTTMRDKILTRTTEGA